MEASTKSLAYPRLSVGTGLLTSFCLIFFSAFVIGIQVGIIIINGLLDEFYIRKLSNTFQVYVLVNFTAEFVTGGNAWGDAYNGTTLASASACILIGYYIFVSLQLRNGNLYKFRNFVITRKS